jgi:hypothetical protein
MPKEFELLTCPNPYCHEEIDEIIVVKDVSTTTAEPYYACPRCCIKLDALFAQFLKKEEPPIKAPEK